MDVWHVLLSCPQKQEGQPAQLLGQQETLDWCWTPVSDNEIDTEQACRVRSKPKVEMNSRHSWSTESLETQTPEERRAVD